MSVGSCYSLFGAFAPEYTKEETLNMDESGWHLEKVPSKVSDQAEAEKPPGRLPGQARVNL